MLLREIVKLQIVEINIPDCPTMPDPTRLPPLYYVGGVGAVLILLMLVGVAGYVRYHRNQEHTTIRRLEVEAEQAVLCARKTCGTCGGQTITDREVDRVAGRKR